MANTITNFLVGIGFDFDEKSADQVGSSIDGVKSKALQLGAVVAGAFGIKALTSDFANANDSIGKFSQTFGVAANDVTSFGRALEHEGGSLESFISQLEGLERLRAGTKQGDFGFVATAQLAGIDTQPFIDATNATEAYLELAEQFQDLSSQQRINAAGAFGLDDASIRLLSRGREGVEQLVQQQKNIRPTTEAMTQASADFNDEMQDLSNNVGGFADKISERLVPEINNVISGMNRWINVNRTFANSGIDKALDFAIENPNAVAAGTGLATAGLLSKSSGLLSKVPLAGNILQGSARFGAAGLGVGSAALLGLAIGQEINKHLSAVTKDIIGRSIAEVLGFFGNETAQEALNSSNRRPTFIDPDEITFNEFDVPSSNRAPPRPVTLNEFDVPSSDHVPQQINLTVEVGGETIDKRIIRVNERQNQITLNELKSVNEG